MKKTKTKNSDDVLRLDNNSILKEIGRMGPCDGTSGCYYCRDWSLLVYKKQVLGKQQQPDEKDHSKGLLKAGAFNVAICSIDRLKAKSKVPEAEFDRDTITTTTPSPLKSYTATCKEWLKRPSKYELPAFLLPLEFDTSLTTHDTNSNEDDDSGNNKNDDDDGKLLDIKKLLQQMTCDKQGVSLTPELLELLIDVDTMAHSDFTASNRLPDCCDLKHSHCLSPTDIEMERAIVNESLAKCVKIESGVMEENLKSSWSGLVEFSASAEVLDREFDCLIGSGLISLMNDFMKQHDKNIVVPFQDFWTPLVPGFKKKVPKKSDSNIDMLATVDSTFINYMDQLLKATEDFYMTFVSTTMVAKIQQFDTSVQNLLKTTEMTIEQRYGTTSAFFGNIEKQMQNTQKRVDELDEIGTAATSLSSLPPSFRSDLLDLKHDSARFRHILTGDLKSIVLQALENVPAFSVMREAHGLVSTLAINTLKTYASEKWKEQKDDIEQLKHIYLKESLPNVASRVEKVAHKEFRKKIKKIEQRYGSMRQGLRYMLHCSLVKLEFDNQKAETDCSFYDVMLKTMKALLYEGEIAEAVVINTRGMTLSMQHKELIRKKTQLENRFTFAIESGQHGLANVIKILVMAESKRLLSENEAIQREMSLTKSIGGGGGGAHAKNKSSPLDSNTTISPLLTVLTALSSGSSGNRKKSKKIKSSPLVHTSGVGSDAINQTPPKDNIPITTLTALAKNTGSSLKSDKNQKEQEIQKEQSFPYEAKQDKKMKTSSDTNAAKSVKNDTHKNGKEKLRPPPGLSTQNQPTKAKTAVQPPLADNNQVDAKKETVLSAGMISKVIANEPINDKNCREIKTEKVSPSQTKSVLPTVGQDQRDLKKEKIHSSGVVKSSPAVPLKKQETRTKAEKVHSFSRKRHQEANSNKQISDTTVAEQNQPMNSWNSPPNLSSASNIKTEQEKVTWSMPQQAPSPPSPTSPIANATWNETTTSNLTSATSTVTWSQAVAKSNPPLSTTTSAMDQFSTQQTDNQTNSGWGQPPSGQQQQTDSWNSPTTSLENSGWGQSVEVDGSPAVTTTTSTEGKNGWSNEWAAKARELTQRTTIDSNDSITNNMIIESINEPKQVNVTLKDIMANSQSSQLSAAPSPVTIAPPPALGNSNTGAAIGYATTPTPLTNDINQLYQLSQESLINIVTSLRYENQQLQQSMVSMQQALSMTMTLAKEREDQTLELFNARKQADLEEARLYILSLEAKIKELELQSRSPPPPSTATTNAFINQDLFADYRQEIRPENSESQQQHHHYNNGNNYQKRTAKKYWPKKKVVKCSNCGESDHTSSDCKDSCRYCGSLGHLSENCAQAW